HVSCVLPILETTSALLVRIRQKLLEMALLICVILLVFWVASFLYGSFYYSFMPTDNFITPVYFYSRTDCPSPHHSVCSFPVANVSLLKNGKHQVTIFDLSNDGQPYQITLELEMPESPANQELGMFLVKMTPYSKAGQIVDVSARSAMLHYHSSLLQALGTVVFSPMLLTGASEQKQPVIVELYSEFKDDSYKPTVGAVIEIHSQHIQIYRAHLYIFAHFTGIRYLMYHFPLISALIGVMSNFAFLSLIIVLSFLQFNLGSHRNPGKVHCSKIEHLLFNIQDICQGYTLQKYGLHCVKSSLCTCVHILAYKNVDAMECNSVEVEESIPDMGVEKSDDDSREVAEDEPICEAGDGEMIL
uniref:Seipin n=1 Tax=Cyprinus carpio TaxID=7962 RepID=A0A8C1JCC0_CYPCA